MKKLESLGLTRLSNLEFGQFIKSTYDELTNKEAIIITDEILINYLNTLEAKSTAYGKVQIQMTKSDVTAKIADADKLRDNAITAFQRILKVFELSDKTSEQEAFVSLSNLLNNYKGIQNWNFAEETNGIDSLLNDLSNPKYNQYLNDLQILSYVERIKTTNEQFRLLFSDRVQETANKEIYDIKILRQEMNNTYNDLSNYVLSLSKALDSEQYNRSLNLINTTRKYYSTIISRRSTKTPVGTQVLP